MGNRGDVDILEQNTRIKYLYKLAIDRKLPHAILLECDDIDLCTEVSKNISKILTCKSEKDVPCNICESCKKIQNNIHPDVEIIMPKKDQKTIGVGTIRDIKRNVYITPNESDVKVYIFPDASLITFQAQNAFLKILEEPPRNIIFIMSCSNRFTLLETVVSRLSYFKIPVVDNKLDTDIFSKAENFIESISSGDELKLLKILYELSNDRNNFMKFLAYIKNIIIKKYQEKSDNENIDMNFTEIIRVSEILKKYEYLIPKNINMSLLVCCMCSDIASIRSNL